MLKQILTLTFCLAIFSVVVAGGFARPDGLGDTGGTFAESSAADDGPWSRSKSRAGSSIPDKNGGEVRLERDGDSHFYVTAIVNGSSIRMMVDSGASIIALTRRDAEAIGIDVDGLPEAGSANTAGGVVPIRPVELNSVGVDGLTVASVQAAVIDADMPTSLLGQSFLSRLQSVEVSGDTMTLR
jgi:aspartyl protease family protein